MKCNSCNLPIDSTKEAHVVIPNPERCGYQRRFPTQFVHASCFEKGVKLTYKQELERNAERQREIEEARGHHSFTGGMA